MTEKESAGKSSRKEAKPLPSEEMTQANLSSLEEANPEEILGPESHTLGATFTRTQTVLIGPLPPPEVLAQYQAIDSSLANRIVEMAEAESKQRHALEQKWLDAKTDDRKAARAQSGRGQTFGFIISLAFLGGALWATSNGNPVVGGALGGGTVLGLVAIFVTGRMFQEKLQQPQDGHKTALADSYNPDEEPRSH